MNPSSICKRLRRCRLFSAAIFSGLLLISFCVERADAQQVSPPATSAHAQIETALKGMANTQSIRQLAISPDGQWLAWIETGKQEGHILIAPLDPAGKLGKSHAVEMGAAESCEQSDPIWSPDSKHLAFFATCGNSKQSNLYLAEVSAKSIARRLTELNGYVDTPAFSPDGSYVGFLYVEGATRPAGAVAAMKPPAGVIGEDGIEIERVAIARVDAAKPGPPVQVTPATLHVYEFDWSPDSKTLAYIAATPPGENNWWVARLYSQTIPANGNAGIPSEILAPAKISGALHGLQIAVPRWSPDGRSIAFIGGLMSDQGATGGDLWMIAASGGEPHNLTAKREATAEWFDWVDDQHIDISELSGGNAQLVRLHIEGNSSINSTFSAPLYSIAASVGDGRMAMSLSAARDHSQYLFQASSFEHAPEIYAAQITGTAMSTSNMMSKSNALSGLTQLTHLNDEAQPVWGKVESLHWKNDGFNVQGWLLQPKNYDPAKRYPMIVVVHGGPSAAVTSRWGIGGSMSAAMLSALGYFVLAPNPRGSFGQGEAFTQANRKDFGYGDLRDILAGVDTVLAKYPVDAKRVGLEGWSYGGFMTMFAVTQTGRFHAAVAGAGISNWQSYYGENSIDQWMTPFFGASVYDDPAVYAKSSAINFIHQAHTPTLIVVGDRDGECPAPQSYEFWHALRDQHVPTQLVVYPNEGHGFVDQAHRQDVLERAIDWFARYMPPN